MGGCFGGSLGSAKPILGGCACIKLGVYGHQIGVCIEPLPISILYYISRLYLDEAISDLENLSGVRKSYIYNIFYI